MLAQLDVEGVEALLQQWIAAQPGVNDTVEALVCDGITLRGSIAETATGAARSIAQVSLRSNRQRVAIVQSTYATDAGGEIETLRQLLDRVDLKCPADALALVTQHRLEATSLQAGALLQQLRGSFTGPFGLLSQLGQQGRHIGLGAALQMAGIQRGQGAAGRLLEGLLQQPPDVRPLLASHRLEGLLAVGSWVPVSHHRDLFALQPGRTFAEQRQAAQHDQPGLRITAGHPIPRHPQQAHGLVG